MDGRDGAIERLPAEGVPLADLGRRLTHGERARHVREAGARSVLGPQVDHDGLARGDGPGSSFVTDGRLRTVADDRFLARHRVGRERVRDRRLEPFAGYGLALEEQL